MREGFPSLHRAKLFRLEPLLFRNVTIEANQTVLNNRPIHRVDRPVGVHDSPDPAVTLDFYLVSHAEHRAILPSSRFKSKNAYLAIQQIFLKIVWI